MKLFGDELVIPRDTMNHFRVVYEMVMASAFVMARQCEIYFERLCLSEMVYESVCLMEMVYAFL